MDNERAIYLEGQLAALVSFMSKAHDKNWREVAAEQQDQLRRALQQLTEQDDEA